MLVSQQNKTKGQDNGHENKDERCESKSCKQTVDFKNVIFMRHGKIGFSYYKTNIYFFVHIILNVIRKVATKYDFFNENVFYQALSKVSKKVKEKLYHETDTAYESLEYRQFMRFLLHKIDPPLAKKNGINVKKIPKDINVIYHSSARRSIESAEYIQENFKHGDKKPRIEKALAMELDEVRFSKDILSKEEFMKGGGLKSFRTIVLKKWYCGINKAETFQDSISRIEKLCDSLQKSSDKSILLITHGWYLRLLYIYFKNKEKSLKNLTSKECIFKHGESFQIRLRHDFSPHVSFTNNNKDTDFNPASLSNPKSNEQNVVEDPSKATMVKGIPSTIH